MSHLFTVAAGTASPMTRTTLAEQGLMETTHLESWVIEHPEVLGDGVIVVATQFDQWRSDAGDSARERLDVLALDTNGQLVVVELKRDGDRRVHLQAITYAALVANFSKDVLGQAHAHHLSRTSGRHVSAEEGLRALTDHVEGDWEVDILRQPRVVLIAERFPSQVLTTAQWLTDVSGGTITVECIEVHLFTQPGERTDLCASFSRIWPVEDLQERILSPLMAEAHQTQRKLVERKRRARSAKIIVDNALIPGGADVHLDLAGWISQDTVNAVNAWMDRNPAQQKVTWVADPTRPLVWSSEGAGEEAYSPTALAKHLISLATDREPPTSIAGGDVWYFGKRSLSAIADEFLRNEEA